MFDMLLSGRLCSFTYEVTRLPATDLPPEYRCELISGDCNADDLDDVESAAIDMFEEDLAQLARTGLKGAA
jgi:hypothetical protein